jgi:integrase
VLHPALSCTWGNWIDTGLGFTTRYGTPIEPRNFNRSFDRCIAALDVHPRVAMRILRHSKIAVTMKIYTETLSDATRDALRKLGGWLAHWAPQAGQG